MGFKTYLSKDDLYNLSKLYEVVFDFILQEGHKDIWYVNYSQPSSALLSNEVLEKLGFTLKNKQSDIAANKRYIFEADLHYFLDFFERRKWGLDSFFSLEVTFRQDNNGKLPILCKGVIITSEQQEPIGILGKHISPSNHNFVNPLQIKRDCDEDIFNDGEKYTVNQGSGALHESVVQSQKELICRFNQYGYLTFVNDAYEKAFQLKKEELIGKKFLDFVPKKDHERLLNVLENLAISGGSQTSQHRVLVAQDQEIWQEWTYYPIYDNDGNFVEFQSVGYDITERKSIEYALGQQTKFKDLLLKIASQYINIPLPQVNQSIDESLGEIGRFVGADRAYICEYNFEKEIGINTFEWCADGILPQIDELQEVPFDDLGLFLEKHTKGEDLLIPNVSEIEDTNVRNLLESQDIKSLLGIPIMKDNQCIGLIGFDSVKNYHYYTETEIKVLKFFAELLVNLRSRATEEKKLRTTQQFLIQTSQVAKVGGWEIEPDHFKATWTSYANEIFNVPSGFHLTLEEISSFIQSDEDLKKLFSLFEQSKSDGTDWTLETQITTYSNDSKWVRLQGGTEFDENKPSRYFGIVQDISSQKDNEHKLQLQSYILSQISEGVIAADTQGDIFYWNKAASNYMGLNEQKKALLKLNDLIYSWNHSLKDTTKTASKDLKKVWSEEMNIKTSSGDDLKVWVKHVPFFGKDQVFLGSILTIFDVTREKKAEKLLRESESKFRSFIENAQDVIFSLNLSGNFQYISPNWESLTGYSVNDTIGRSIYEIIQKDDLDPLKDFLQEIIKSEKGNHSISFKIELEDGVSQWHLCSFSVLYDQDGQVESLLGITRDISHIKATELALIDSEREAKLMAQKYKNIIESQSVFVVKTDVAGKYSFANEYFYKYFDPQKTMKEENRIMSIFEDSRDSYRETVTKCITKPNQPHELILRRNINGQLYGTKWEFKGITDGHGNVVEILCVGFDITQQMESLDKAQELIQVISDQNNRLKSFAHIVSHDIRSHSSNILSLTDFLNQVEDEEEQKLFLQMLTQSANKLEQTIRDLNEILTINEQLVKQSKVKNLARQVNKTAESLHGHFYKENVLFENRVPTDIEIEVIPSYLDSILLNIIGNAVKYKSPKRRPEIKVTAIKEDNYIVMEVKDNGLGIDLQRYGEKVFGMYKTFHGNEDARGFGLYITRNQIEAMGGNIKVESQVDVGSSFKVYLPLK